MAYKCNNCSYEDKKFFGLCPKCKAGVGEETADTLTRIGGVPTSTTSTNSKSIPKIDPTILVPANVKVTEQKSFITTQYPDFNSVLSSAGGFLRGQVVLLAAQPGIGKSTLCASLAQTTPLLYITTEESAYQVAARFQRILDSVDSETKILSTMSVEEAVSAIESTPNELVIIDSLNNFEDGASYQRVSKITTMLMRQIKRLGKTGILISQVTKSGEATGMNSTIHTPDTVLYMERGENANIILYSTKNRFGPVGEIAVFEHNEHGLSEISGGFSFDSGIGIANAYMHFGSKKIPVSAQALVTEATGNYGQAFVSGCSINKVKMLVGIVGYYIKQPISMTKNVYVATSQGLRIDSPKFDATICAAILSSLYGVESNIEISGEVRLDGKIISDHKSIRNIGDLVRAIKNGSY